jgi:hypothetical protein
LAFDIGMDAQSMLLPFASVEEEDSCSADIEKKRWNLKFGRCLKGVPYLSANKDTAE